MVTKICVGDYVGNIYHHAKFYPNRFRGFVSAHAWFRVPLRKVTRLFFFGGVVLEQGYRRDARTAFDARYGLRSNDAVLRKEVPWGSQNKTPIFPKNRHFGHHFDGTEFFARKRL